MCVADRKLDKLNYRDKSQDFKMPSSLGYCCTFNGDVVCVCRERGFR